MTTQEILAQVIAGKLTGEDAAKLIEQNTPARVDVTKPRLQKDGKLCVMPGTTLTAYQLIRTKQVCDELLAIAKAEIDKPSKIEKAEGRPNKAGEKDTFERHFCGSLLVAYKPEHVAIVKQFFAKV